MEARMHPRSEGNQRCLTFHLAVSPRCRVFAYRDHVGNNIHHFDIPGTAFLSGDRGGISARCAAVARDSHLRCRQTHGPKPMRMVKMGDYWEMLLPSEFAQPTPAFARTWPNSWKFAGATTLSACCAN